MNALAFTSVFNLATLLHRKHFVRTQDFTLLTFHFSKKFVLVLFQLQRSEIRKNLFWLNFSTFLNHLFLWVSKNLTNFQANSFLVFGRWPSEWASSLSLRVVLRHYKNILITKEKAGMTSFGRSSLLSQQLIAWLETQLPLVLHCVPGLPRNAPTRISLWSLDQWLYLPFINAYNRIKRRSKRD